MLYLMPLRLLKILHSWSAHLQCKKRWLIVSVCSPRKYIWSIVEILSLLGYPVLGQPRLPLTIQRSLLCRASLQSISTPWPAVHLVV
uniref:Putative ovule protein n=1 Tax=Solanum chacoense TaxID=4108 RepID=A0A0V0GL66_SOLCH